MEKDKGLFSFRKHSVGNFLDGKKGRKSKGNRLRRSMGILLAAALIFNTLPARGGTVSASEQEKGLCEHHRSHTAECGYAEEQDCGYVCEICNGTEPENTENNAENDTENDGTDTAECICETLCTEDSINGDCPVCGAEDADLLGCTGKETENSSEEDTENAGTTKETENEKSEDTDGNLCAHHREHTADCGYIPKSEDGEGSPCTYECRICPIEDLIAALPERVTEDNADDVRARLDEILALYRELDEDEQEQIDISRCLRLQEALNAVNVSAPAADGTPDLELFGQKVYSGDSGDGWSYTSGVLTLENFHSDNSSEDFIHVTNVDLEFTLYVKGNNSVKTSGKLIWGSVYGSMTIRGEQGASLSLDGKSWSDRYISIYGVTMDVTMQEMIFIAYDMEIDNATVKINMNGSSGYIYTTHGGFTVKNGSDVTITNTSGVVDYCVATNKAEITDSTLKIINPSGFGVYVTKLSQQPSEYKASVTNSAISADVFDAAVHCEEEVSVANSQVTGSGRFLLRSKKAITVDGSSTMEGITYEFFKSDTGAVYQVYGSHTLAANLTVAEDGSFVIPEGAALTIPDGVTLENNGTMRIHDKTSLTGTGALVGSGEFLIDVNEDMISVPEDLIYTGEDYTDQVTLERSVTIGGVEFTADTEGWTCNIAPAVVKDAGEYTVTFTKEGKEISKTFTVAKSGTEFTGGIKTYNGETETTSFTADDTITVKAMPTATGAAPQKAAARLRSDYTAPTAGQMALFVGDVQVSEPAETADGTCTMTVSALDVLTLGGMEPNGAPITLTAKFVGNDNTADVEGTADVNISAVARVEKGSTTTYVGALSNAFTEGNSGATVTLLADVNLGDQCITLSAGNITLTGSGRTLTGSGRQTIEVTGGELIVENMTVKNTNSESHTNSGIHVPSGKTAKVTVGENAAVTGSTGIYQESGSLTVSGTVEGTNVSGFGVLAQGVALTVEEGAKISGGNEGIRHTIGGSLTINGGTINGRIAGVQITEDVTAKLNGGTFTGVYNAVAINGSVTTTMGNLLNTGYAIFKDDGTAVERTETSTGPGTFTVQECEHDGVTSTSNNNGTHSINCPYCGHTGTATNCAYVFSGTTGTCAECGDSVTVAVAGTENLIYDGTEKKPGVTVTRADTELTAGTDYTVVYGDNIDAGTAAKMTVTIGNNQGTYNGSFTIGKATPTIAWSSTSQELTYTGQQAVITAPTVTLKNNENFSKTISYSYKKQGGTDYKDGLPTDAGTYTIKAHVDAEGNYNAADSTNELTLTIKKADAEITVGTAAYDVNYGDPAFTISGVTDTNPETAVQYAVTKGTDVVDLENGTVTIRNAGTATITVSLPATANYNAAENKTITVTVDKKSGYTVAALNRNYYYQDGGTDSIDLGVLLPKDCGNVTYGEPAVSGNVTYSATPAVSGGKLSYTLNSGNINDAGTITVTVATRNYEDITVTVNVKLTDQIPVSLKAGTEVTLKNNALTYGEPLSDLAFNEAEFVTADGKTVTGTLAWKEAAATPNAGAASAVWIFTPAENKYASLEGTAAITVNKAVPTVSAAPAVADRIYNPSVTLKGDDLTGATVTGVDGNTLKGGWNWQSADIVPTVNNSGYAAIFTPEDTTNYETVTRIITVNVTKATPYIAKSPAAAGITYGDTLNASALSGGTVQYGNGAGQAGGGDGDTGTAAGNTNPVAGTFTWKEPSAKPVVADSNVTEYTVVFTPSDTANYNPVETKVTLTVNKAHNAPNMPGSTMDVSNSLEKVGDVSLPEGWKWQASDRDTALEVGKPVSAVAVYAGADKGNYEKETVTVVITRSACDHVAGEILYTGAGEKAPTCRSDGLGHRECTKCGSVVESGIVVKALGHTGGKATCSQRAVCTRCGQSYGDTDGSVHGDTEVHGFVAATCTAGGYTGDTYCKDCGAKTKTGNATPALGHNYASMVTKEPTTGSEGTRTYTCTRCGHSYTRPIAKLPGGDTTKPEDDTAKPGDTKPDGGSAETRPDTGIPFIKGEDGKTGWDVIRAEEEKAQEGSTINVDMNGSAVVPGDIFDRLKGKDITITFDMGSGILWSVDGKSITRDASRDKAGDIDFSVETETNAIPVDIVNNVTGERYSIQISLTHEGEFGFTAVLSIGLGKENAGYTASLYYYNESTGELEFICKDQVAEDGTVSLAFTHASDYVIAIDGEEESSGVTEPAQPENQDADSTGQAWRPWWLIVAGALVIIMGVGVFFAVKKRKDGDSGQ